MRIAALDAEHRQEGADAVGHRADRADLRQLVEAAAESLRGIRIERDASRSADLQVSDVGLINAGAHAHHRSIDNVADWKARAHFLTFLHFAHRAVLPRGLQNDQPVDLRFEPILADIYLYVRPGVMCPYA